MPNCGEARALILQNLMQDIEAHEQGRYSEIGGFDERYVDIEKCDEENETEAERLSLTLRLWECWEDSRNHDWRYYPGVEQKDWPIIARQIYRGIVEHWKPDQMRDNFLFNPPPHVPFWQRLKNRFSGGSAET